MFKKKTKKNQSRFAAKWENLKDLSVPVCDAPECVQDIIPVSRIQKNGTFEIEPDNDDLHLFDRVYKFSDINFTTKDDEEREKILTKYYVILNGLNVAFKIVTANLSRDKGDFTDVYIKKKSPTEMEKDFAETYNSIIEEKLSNKACFIDQSKYIVLTIKKKTFEDADVYFDQLEGHLVNEFADLGSELELVSGIERLNILYRAYRVDPQFNFQDRWNDLLSEEFQDMIAPMTIKPIDMNGRQYIQIDDHYCCTLVIRKNGYPSKLSNKFIRQITALPYPSIVTLDIQPIPADTLQDTLVKKLDSVELKIARQQETRNKNEQYSSDITRNVQKEKEHIKEYLDQVTDDDQNMFFSQVLISVFADSLDELDSKIDNIQQIGRSVSVDMSPYTLQQIEAFNTALPVGGRYVNTMLRSLFTNALVCFVPFNVQELYQKEGKYYGTNSLSKKLVVGDRRTLLNGNGWIFGVPGTGKSFFAKMEIGQILAGSEDDVLIIDPQNEYKDFVLSFGGQYIDLSAASSSYVNPLDIDVRMAKKNINEYITSKSEFALDILSQMSGRELDMIQKSCVDKAARSMFLDIFNSNDEDWISPTFVTLQKYLQQQGSDEATMLAAGLYAFTEGSLSLFSHQSNVEINSRLVAFGTKNLGKELRRISMLIMLEAIRSRLNENQEKGKVTWVYVDEAHELTAEEFTAKSLERSYKEIRKQGGFMTGMTQNITDCLLNKTTRTMVANSEFITLLGQANVDLEPLLDVVDVSRNELNYVQTEKKGEGLLRFGKTIIPVNNFVENKDSNLYRLFNTNPHEKSVSS